jgi:hypothetical protein
MCMNIYVCSVFLIRKNRTSGYKLNFKSYQLVYVSLIFLFYHYDFFNRHYLHSLEGQPRRVAAGDTGVEVAHLLCS